MRINGMLRRATLAGALGVLAALPARAVSFGDINLVDLLRSAESIVVAHVDSMTDGIGEQGLPYTEITLSVEESIRGVPTGSYTYRQYGLMAPRSLGNGRVVPAAPELFPSYRVGQRVLLFLYTPAVATGLQTTVALEKGSFDLESSRAENAFANAGLFLDIGLANGLPVENDLRLLATASGPVNSESMLSIVRRAVSEQWIETKRMWKLSEGNPNPKPPPPPGKVYPRPGNSITPQLEDSGAAGVR